MSDREIAEHVVFLALLASRVADVLTTRLASPKLVLEANPIVRRLGWWYAWLTLAIAFVAYFNVGVAWALAVAFFLVAAQNARSAWLVRALGERDFYEQVVVRAAGRSRFGAALGTTALSSLLLATVGVGIFLTSFENGWAAWASMGMIGFALISFVHQSLALRRAFRIARSRGAEVAAAG